MARKREQSEKLPPHVHKVNAKGKDYFFYQAHRGTAKAGPRIALPHSSTAEFWKTVKELAGTVPGYTGTLSAMIDAYIASTEYQDELAKSSKRVYLLYLRKVQKIIGEDKPDAVRPAHILALRDRFKETKSASNLMIRVLSAAYKWGRPRDYATLNPCEKIPQFDGGEHDPWPQDVIDLVMENARWEIRRFVSLTLATGQRGGDVCGMSLKDIKDDSVRVVQEKTGKEIWIPLPADAQSIVEECRKEGKIYLISKRTGEPYTAPQFYAMWKRELKKKPFASIRASGFVPHGLCKNAHNELFEAGNNESEVQAVTGRSAKMVQHYGKARNQRVSAKRAAVRRDEYRAEKVLQSGSKA